MSDFSKGKWRYSETNNTVVINDDKYIPVAFLVGCSMFSKQEYQANGRLMAAAPEMYELLEDVAWYLEQIADDDDENAKYASRSKALLAQIDGMSRMSEQLKPCPFCGSEKLIIDDYPCEDGVPCNWGRKEFFVYCSTCGGASGCKFTKEEAVAAWNRRVSND